MRIDNDFEYRAARATLKKYGFQPSRSKNHALQASMEVIAEAMKNYERVADLTAYSRKKAA